MIYYANYKTKTCRITYEEINKAADVEKLYVLLKSLLPREHPKYLKIEDTNIWRNLLHTIGPCLDKNHQLSQKNYAVLADAFEDSGYPLKALLKDYRNEVLKGTTKSISRLLQEEEAIAAIQEARTIVIIQK